MTRTQLGNAFGPGREVDVCPVCGAVVLVPRDGEPEYPEPHTHAAHDNPRCDWCYQSTCDSPPFDCVNPMHTGQPPADP